VVTDQNGLSSSATVEVVISAKITTPLAWSLDNLSGRVPLPGTQITLQFAAGQFSGFAGCNSYQGAYTNTANPDGTYSVALSGMTTTAMSCPEEIMAQERIYLAMLSTVTTAQIQGDMLTLIFPAGAAPSGQQYPQGSLTYVQAVTPAPY
jgi:heat shock protein HslJ